MKASDTLSVTFSALSDPTRRAILARLAQGAASVSELAEPFDISLPAISRHLRVLREAGLIERETDAQWRRCSLSADPLRDAAQWLHRYRPFWEQQFDALERHLKRKKTHHHTKRTEESDHDATSIKRGSVKHRSGKRKRRT